MSNSPSAVILSLSGLGEAIKYDLSHKADVGALYAKENKVIFPSQDVALEGREGLTGIVGVSDEKASSYLPILELGDIVLRGVTEPIGSGGFKIEYPDIKLLDIIKEILTSTEGSLPKLAKAIHVAGASILQMGKRIDERLKRPEEQDYFCGMPVMPDTRNGQGLVMRVAKMTGDRTTYCFCSSALRTPYIEHDFKQIARIGLGDGVNYFLLGKVYNAPKQNTGK